LGREKVDGIQHQCFIIFIIKLMISGWVLLIYTFYKGTFLFVHGEILCFMQQMYKISRIKEVFQTL